MGKRSTVEKRWTAHGLDCAVLRMDMGHRCGYCRVPDDHPWKGLNYSDAVPEAEAAEYAERSMDDAGMAGMIALLGGQEGVDTWSRRVEAHVAVHGGLTFSGEGLSDDITDGWWFGFDCAHSGDWLKWEPGGRLWDLDEVAAETERMAEQIASVQLQEADRA